MKTTRGAFEFNFPGSVLCPMFFLGVISHLESLRRLRTDWDFAQIDEEIGLSSFMPGQFILPHQYGGHSCFNNVLIGAFMPLSTCKDAKIREGLRGAARNFYEGDGTKGWLADFRPRLKEDLGRIPGWDLFDYEAHEAFIRFNEAERVLRWSLEKGFEYITEVEEKPQEEVEKERAALESLIEPPDDAEVDRILAPHTSQASYPPDARRKTARHILLKQRLLRDADLELRDLEYRVATEIPPWTDLYDFSQWLSSSSRFSVEPEQVIAALIYWNSD